MRNSDNLSDCKKWINSEPKNGQARMEHPFRKSIVLNLDDGCVSVLRDILKEYGWMIYGVTGIPSDFEVEPGFYVKHLCDRVDVRYFESVEEYRFAIMQYPWSNNNFRVNDFGEKFSSVEELERYNASSLIGRYGLTPYDMLLVANKYKGKKFYVDFRGRSLSSIQWFLKCVAKSADIELMCAIASSSSGLQSGANKQSNSKEASGSRISNLFFNLYFGCWSDSIKEHFNSDMAKFELEKFRTATDLRGIDRVIPKS